MDTIYQGVVLGEITLERWGEPCATTYFYKQLPGMGVRHDAAQAGDPS